MSLLVVGITAFAQEKENKRQNGERYASLTPEQKVEMHVKRISKDLNLNENQTNEVRELATKEVEKREKSKSEMKERKNIKRKEMQTEQAAIKVEMKKILNPEQFAKWEKMNAERKEKVKEKMDKKRGGQPLNELPEQK